MKTSKSARLGVGAIVFVVLVAGWYLLLWKPTTQKVASLNSQVSAVVLQQSKLEAQLLSLKASAKHLTSLKAEATTLSNAIPSQPSLANFVDDLNQAGSAAGLSITTISPTQPQLVGGVIVPTAGSGVPSIAFSISTEGGYYQLLQFLHNLDFLPRFVAIDSISFSPTTAIPPGFSPADAPIISASLTGRFFVK